MQTNPAVEQKNNCNYAVQGHFRVTDYGTNQRRLTVSA